MMIAVASGKGGTGKTTVAVSLALALEDEACLLDCDVEEPNAHIFLSPEFSETEIVRVAIPEINSEKCRSCGRCAEACRFNAIAPLKKRPLVFEELCHSCGACMLLCPAGAITEKFNSCGKMDIGFAGEMEFVSGTLDLGRTMAVPLIKAVKKRRGNRSFCIVDCPPGASCPMVAAVRGSDFVILVAEPTLFGLNDLEIAYEAVKYLGLPCGIVINRCDGGNDGVERFCNEHQIPVLMRIPELIGIAQGYSRGVPLLKQLPGLRDEFLSAVVAIKTILGRAEA